MGSTLTVDNIVGATTAANVKLPAGAVLQTVQGNTSAVATYSIAASNTSSAVLSATITPKFATSKILITGQISGAADSRNHSFFITLHKGTTNIGLGDASSNRRRCHSGFAQYIDGSNGETLGHGTINFLDSPSTTSATTYNVLLSHNSGGAQNFHMNRTDLDSDSIDRPRTMSTLTLMEIAQ
tara:strand:+ start:232 stop:780 length:549 start_codon:yes stop_codon:yes gene_type:complete